MSMLPNSRPKLTHSEVLTLLSDYNLTAYPVKLVGIRGYYKQTMGNPVKNDRGIYDDAIFLLSPDGFLAYNANTDPSVTRTGVASLKVGGPYLYKIGMHNMKAPYKALRQYGRVTVQRDGGSEVTDTAKAPFYIDIHKGGFGTTSSLGCQTIPPAQWTAFLATVEDQLKRNKQTIVPYVLLEM